MARVNALCRLHQEGFEEGDQRSRQDLEDLVKLAEERGYGEGNRVLEAGLDPSAVRRACWNISSVLTDRDLVSRGIDLGSR